MHASNRKILVVDDEEIMRDLLTDYLEMTGYSVDSAENGDQAFKKIEKKGADHFSLVLTDINMPVMGGIDLQKKIKSSYPDLPVVFMTGYGVETVREELAGQAQGFLGKPFQLDELTSVLVKVLTEEHL